MNINISPIIEAAALLKLLNTENLVLIDAGNRTNYLQKHLSGALFVDLNTDLADIKDDLSIGGRHPLPKIENFSKTLAFLGITTKSHIVVYDDKAGANSASRFWWMLKSIGHEKVQVLNGGIQATEAIGFPMSSNEEIAAKTDLYKFDHWKLQIAEIDEVETASADVNKIVIDVRDAARYNGEVEPIDLIAGHIPGVINVPFTTNLDKNGLFLSPNELKLKYEKILGQKKSEDIIVHCGSGVTACHTLLALAYAGLDIPKLYVGSWSEWSRNNKAIATKTVK
jgi:thiosulfate/3-mercaptopyruvate sulfurtransferase